MYTFDLRYLQRKNRKDLNQVNGRANRRHHAMRSNDQGHISLKETKQNGIICTFGKRKHFFVSLFYLAFIKPTNVSDHFSGPCITCLK